MAAVRAMDKLEENRHYPMDDAKPELIKPMVEYYAKQAKIDTPNITKATTYLDLYEQLEEV